MTPEEIRQKLKEAGINVGEGWTENGERYVKSPLIERQKKMLGKIEGLLEQQIQEDQQKVAELHIALQRIRNGGGS